MSRNPLANLIYIFILVLIIGYILPMQSFGLVERDVYNRSVLSRVDLRKYFEKAMSLFESGKYKEAIVIFQNLIDIEKSQNESYFTPFAEIYIEKANNRLKELMVLEDKRWARMKEDVIGEAERLAKEEEERARREKELIIEEQRQKRIAIEEDKKKEAEKIKEEVQSLYRDAIQYFQSGRFPEAIVAFKKLKELAPDSRFATEAESYIETAQKKIKDREQKMLLTRMEAARRAKMEQEQQRRQREIELARKEIEKQRLKTLFEARLKERERIERIKRIETLMDEIRTYAREEKYDEAEQVLNIAIKEFPENERFKDILHYIEMEKLKKEEKALERAREIAEERMLLEVARSHILPETRYGKLEEERKTTPLIRVPEIRKRLKIPISIDFKDIGLDYVLSFLSDATGVNIIPSSQIDMKEKKVTIKVKDMPLEDALRYILKSQDLVYRIEEDAIWVATKEEMNNEQIETRVYFLEQGIGRFAEFSGVYNKEGEETTSGEVKTKTIKDIIENAVDWPKDSKLTMDDRTGALIVTNIPSNLEIIENLLYNLDVTPKQVLIEARFMEVVVNDLDELGLEWKLNSDFGLSQNNQKQNRHGFASGSGVDFSDFSNKDYGFNLTYRGILSHPQFQFVLHALQQKQNVKTLSAPRITTLNNQIATIEVVDEYIYPTRYEVSLVQYDINGDGDFDDAGETEWANIPQDFVTRNVGILLHVKPSVGADNNTITLALTPEVSEQDTTTSAYTYKGNVSIPNFKTRNLSTSVMLKSGETVVLGGLIKETTTDTKTKVPLLGDLPIVGGLFRRNYENVERRNLLIFVTATVMEEEKSVMVNTSSEKRTLTQ